MILLLLLIFFFFFFFSSRRRHTRYIGDWSSDVCSSDLREIDGHRECIRGHDDWSPEGIGASCRRAGEVAAQLAAQSFSPPQCSQTPRAQSPHGGNQPPVRGTGYDPKSKPDCEG